MLRGGVQQYLFWIPDEVSIISIPMLRGGVQLGLETAIVDGDGFQFPCYVGEFNPKIEEGRLQAGHFNSHATWGSSTPRL